MRILGIDPGYAIVGYGVIEAAGGRYRPVEYGAVTTPAGQDFGQRLVEIYQGMGEILTRLKPQAAAVENVPLYEYTPMQVKQAVTGYGKAVKPQVQEMTRRLLRLQKVPQPDDTADALALAICHGQAAGSPLRKTLLQRGHKPEKVI